ncbi:hypothetical protein HPP92_021642 [Vanilla planifolia]|uniref:Uncharacterized protein n=1 Tax=Vanilla planifolia TaxID=51239 RepID=A0A835PVX9_VANPL|nr:hypothetical protein HPP92_021642 [Vanilla planifolia]
MNEEERKAEGADAGETYYHSQHNHRQSSPQYGTFEGLPTHQSPAIGFPQPVPPPGATGHPQFSGPTYYPHGYQAVPDSWLVSFLLLFLGMLEHSFFYVLEELIIEKSQDMLLVQLQEGNLIVDLFAHCVAGFDFVWDWGMPFAQSLQRILFANFVYVYL